MTVLFADGFETGDVSRWTGSAVAAGDALNVVTTRRHHGSYSLQCDIAGDGSGSAYVYETIAASAIVYCRANFRLETSSLAPDDNITVIEFRGTDRVAWVGFSASGAGVLRFTLACRNAAAIVYTQYNYPFVLNRWYCIELYLLVDGVNGEAYMYIDGVATSDTGNDTNNYGDITSVRVGVQADNVNAAHEVYVDCAVIADARIGCEPLEKFHMPLSQQYIRNFRSRVFQYRSSLSQR